MLLAQRPGGAIHLAFAFMPIRVSVYVDGFNLFYRGLKGTTHKWLDLKSFSEKFTLADQSIESIKYFTARVSGRQDADAPARQQAYLNALKTIPCYEPHFGRFLSKTGRKPRVLPNDGVGPTVEVHLTEEKGSDVNLAVHLVNDAHLNRFDVALVLSQDSDLLEPMKMVKYMGKPVGIVWLELQSRRAKRPSSYHRDASTFIKFARRGHYTSSQFPNEILAPDGSLIASKPQDWR